MCLTYQNSHNKWHKWWCRHYKVLCSLVKGKALLVPYFFSSLSAIYHSLIDISEYETCLIADQLIAQYWYKWGSSIIVWQCQTQLPPIKSQNIINHTLPCKSCLPWFPWSMCSLSLSYPSLYIYISLSSPSWPLSLLSLSLESKSYTL